MNVRFSQNVGSNLSALEAILEDTPLSAPPVYWHSWYFTPRLIGREGMVKVDFTKELRHLYHPSATVFELVEVPAMTYLMLDGHGDPNTAPEYSQAVEALYTLAYRVKFISKDELAKDYVVPPLEGLWWAENRASFTTARDKSVWDWTMMIMLPDWISAVVYQRALDDVRRKKELSSLHKIRREPYQEGLCVQILHIGSYDDEEPLLTRLHQQWIPQQGYVENGKHHEIYLSDARRVEKQS
jgi:hypothetical protein